MKRQDNDDMRNGILEAVIVCKINAAGAEVSLSQIASRASISERTLNRYFPDKEMMLYDAAIRYLRRGFDKFAAAYAAADKTGLNGLERLALLLQMQADQNARNINGAKVYVRAYTTALRTAVYRDLPVSGFDAPVREQIYECIRAGVADGSIRADVVPMDTYMMISSNYTGLLQRLIYIYSVQATMAEHQRELLVVFGNYIDMLRQYLSPKRR